MSWKAVTGNRVSLQDGVSPVFSALERLNESFDFIVAARLVAARNPGIYYVLLVLSAFLGVLRLENIYLHPISERFGSKSLTVGGRQCRG